jgi:DNA-directed RNA polymerase sigma subunit (sigma70/sigma32)
MLALNKYDEGSALPPQQERVRRDQAQARQRQRATDRVPAPPGTNHESGIIRIAFSTAKSGTQARARASHTAAFPARHSDQAITLYLREIGQVPRLTPAEELELLGRIRKGDRRARERLIKAKLRLVVKISREYENIGLPLLDLISEGNLGLLKAVERFDPAKDTDFSACSAWWIKQAIKRALASQSRTVSQPARR